MQQVAEANRALGQIKRIIASCHPLIIRKLYNALVGPHLEFGCPVTNPQYKGDVAAESVQRRATKICAPHQQISYPESLCRLKILILVYWWHRGNVIFVKKMYQNNMANSIFTPSLATMTRDHLIKLQQEHSRRREGTNFFLVHAVSTWTSLSNETVTGESLNSLKNAFDLECINEE